MADRRITIDIVANLVDQVTDKADRVQRRTKRLGQEKARVRIEADDRASSTIGKVSNKVARFAKRSWKVTVGMKDMVTSPLRRIRESLFSLKTLAAGVFAGFATQKLIFQPVGLADSIESSRIAFETKLGSTEKANKFLQDIYKFDEKSPFDTMQIVKITQQMMNMGWEAKSALTDLEIIGDWAASMGKGEAGIQRVTLALGLIVLFVLIAFGRV